jgi:hypothetical protein
MSKETRSLWEQLDSEVELWRRGRFAIILILILIGVGQLATAALSIFNGTVDTFVVSLITGWIAFFVIYLVWIGQNWVRWILAPFFGFWGFCDLVWGIVRSNGLLLTAGAFYLVIFAYLGIAPSVYAFARHQRERIQSWEIMAAAGAFLLGLVSIGCLLAGLVGYEKYLERDGLAFAKSVFQRIFVDHDSDYLAQNSNPDKYRQHPEARAAAFVARTSQLGPVKTPPSFRSALVLRYMDGHLRAFDHVFARTEFETATVSVDIRISKSQDGWGIDHLDWN